MTTSGFLLISHSRCKVVFSRRFRRNLAAFLLFAITVAIPGASYALAKSQARRARPHGTSGQFTLLYPSTVTFPVTVVGSSSATVSISLEDSCDDCGSGAAAAITGFSVSGDFRVAVEAGDSCDGYTGDCLVDLVFTPTATGSRTGTLIFSSGGIQYQAQLSGVGVSPGAGATTTTIAQAGSSGSYSLSAAVNGNLAAGVPTGSISFVDSSNGNLSLGSAAPGNGTIVNGLTYGPSTKVSTQPLSAAVGDFNGDGKPDVAIANYPTFSNPGALPDGLGLTILLGNGDGTFTTVASPVPGSVLGEYLLTGDFNGDGKLDLVTSDVNSHTVVLLGNGDGTFTAAPVPSLTGLGSAYLVGDFNGDGKPDIIAETYSDEGNGVVVLLGNGDGTFTAGAAVENTHYESNLISADFNGDGKLDLMSLEYDFSGPGSYSNYAIVYLGNGDGTFQPPRNVPFNGLSAFNINKVASGDFNGDGKVDLIFEGDLYSSSASSVDAYVVLLGDGTGSFTAGSPVALPLTPTNGGVAYASENPTVTVTDFNGDGIPDIAFLNDVTLQVLTGNGDGTFTPSTGIDSGGEGEDPRWWSLVVADFNGDGISDFLGLDSDTGLATVAFGQRTETSTVTLANVIVPGTGNHNIVAVYGGGSGFAASTSAPISLAASPLATAIALTSSAGNSTYGVQLSLTATLTPSSFSTLGTNGEVVTFSSGGTTIGTTTLSSGVATLNLTTLPVGTDSLTASYAGDGYFAPAASAALPVVVGDAVAGATLSPAGLSFTAQDVGTTSAPQTVTLTNTGQAALTITSIVTTSDFAQTNTCGTSVAAGAACAISVSFTPTTGGSRTGTLTISDNAGSSPQALGLSGGGEAVAISAPGAPISLAASGGSATALITLAPQSGFTGTVNLTCAVSFLGQGTATNPPTCALNPAQAQITGGSSVTTTLTVSTVAASAAAVPASFWKGSEIALGTVLFLGLLPSRRWRRHLLAVLLSVACVGAIMGCGGSSQTSTTTAGTTAGSYRVLVTATSGAVTATTTLQLSVE